VPLIAANELIDGIGVAPDASLPLTAADLSSGRDPDVERTLALLRHPGDRSVG
jgi:hypothetical protein